MIFINVNEYNGKLGCALLVEDTNNGLKPPTMA
jgi:hypothetical protein